MFEVRLMEGELPSLDVLVGELAAPEVGAVVTFSGLVKAKGGTVGFMRFSPQEDLPERLTGVLTEAAARFGLNGAILAHRLGTVPAGEEILRLVCAAQVRRGLLEAVGFIVERIKQLHAGWAEELAP